MFYIISIYFICLYSIHNTYRYIDQLQYRVWRYIYYTWFYFLLTTNTTRSTSILFLTSNHQKSFIFILTHTESTWKYTCFTDVQSYSTKLNLPSAQFPGRHISFRAVPSPWRAAPPGSAAPPAPPSPPPAAAARSPQGRSWRRSGAAPQPVPPPVSLLASLPLQCDDIFNIAILGELQWVVGKNLLGKKSSWGKMVENRGNNMGKLWEH